MLLLSSGIHVRDFLLEGQDIYERHEDYRAGDLGGIDFVDEALNGNDGGVFGAVGAGNYGENRAGLGATDDHYGDARAGVHSGGDFDEAVDFLAGCGGGGAHREARLLGGNGMARARAATVRLTA